ncbi:MAG: ABC transporter permease [Candidatus Acidiferrales bacterium]
MSTAPNSVSLQALPPTRITPPSGWWELHLAELWQYRELLYFFVWRDIKIRYKQTAIGAAWVVLQPLLPMVIFTLFFGKLAHISSNGLPYPIFYMSALLPWLYFAGALQNATNTIVENQRVITKVYFPRLALPLAAILPGILDFCIGIAVYAVMMAIYHIAPTAAILFAPALLLLVVATAFGAGLWLSALNALYRDVRYVLPSLITFWMFASPVAYASSLVPVRFQWLYGLNPMVGVIEGFRWSLTGQGRAPIELILVAAAVTFLLTAGGLVYFQRMETKIADMV